MEAFAMKLFTTEEKLREVENLIEAIRQTSRSDADDRRLAVMKALATDLRGRLDTAPNIALTELERRVAAAVRSKSSLGYKNGAMVGLGEELIGRWPTVRQALEKFGADQ